MKFIKKLQTKAPFDRINRIDRIKYTDEVYHHFMLSLNLAILSPASGFLKIYRCSCSIR